MLPGDVRLTVTCRADDMLTCELAGELDASCGEAVVASLRAAAHDRRPLTIVLDELRFCGAVGLRLLKEVGEIRAAAASPVLITGASDTTVRVLRMMDLPSSVDLRSRSARSDDDALSVDDRDIASASLEVMPLAELSGAVEALVSGVVGVSVSVERPGGFETIAATAATAAELDLAQYDLREGPCVEAVRRREQAHDQGDGIDARWPAFAAHAHRRGVRSIISTPLGRTGEVGALNVYARNPTVGSGTLHGLEQLATLVGALVEGARR